MPKTLKVWACGCPHIPEDTLNARSSMSLAISHMESSRASRIDFGVVLGDFSANQDPSEIATYASEGADCRTQLSSGTNNLTRDYLYTLRGNHDAGDGQNNWYDTYIGLPQNPPYPFLSGATADYRAIKTGNVIWLFFDDINHGAQPCGRSGGSGGFPSGSTSLSAYNYWVSLIETYTNCMIIVCAHNSLKNTTIATGDNEGVNGGYHGSSGQAVGSGRLHNVITDLNSNTYTADQTMFMDYMALHPNRCVLWLCAHTHANVGEAYSGRTHDFFTNGCYFKNVGHLTLYHGTTKNTQSRVLTFTQGSPFLQINTFLHDTSLANIGYYGNTQTLSLPMPVEL